MGMSAEIPNGARPGRRMRRSGKPATKRRKWTPAVLVNENKNPMGNTVQLPVARGESDTQPLEICLDSDRHTVVCRLYRLHRDAARRTYTAVAVQAARVVADSVVPPADGVRESELHAMQQSLRGAAALPRANGRAWDTPGGRVYRFDDAEDAVFLWEPRDGAPHDRFPRRPVPAGLGAAWAWLRAPRFRCAYCQRTLAEPPPPLPACGHRDACGDCLRWAAQVWTDPAHGAYPPLPDDGPGDAPGPGWRCRACPRGTPRVPAADLAPLADARARPTAATPPGKRLRTAPEGDAGRWWRVVPADGADGAFAAVAPGRGRRGGPVAEGARSHALAGAPGLTLWQDADGRVWLREAAAADPGPLASAFGRAARCPDYVPALLWLVEHAPPVCSVCNSEPADAVVGCGHRYCAGCVVEVVERRFPACTLCEWFRVRPEDVFPLRREAVGLAAWAEVDGRGAAGRSPPPVPALVPSLHEQRALYATARDTLRRSVRNRGRIAYAGYADVVAALAEDAPDDRGPPAEDDRGWDSEEERREQLRRAVHNAAHLLHICERALFIADLRHFRWGRGDRTVVRDLVAASLPREATLLRRAWLRPAYDTQRDEWLRGWLLAYLLVPNGTDPIDPAVATAAFTSAQGRGLLRLIQHTWVAIVAQPSLEYLMTWGNSAARAYRDQVWALIEGLPCPMATLNLLSSVLVPLPHTAAMAAEDDRDVVLRHLPPAAREAIQTNDNTDATNALGEEYEAETVEAFRWPLDAWERAVAAIQILLVDRGCMFPWGRRRYVLQDVAVFCSSVRWPLEIPELRWVATWPQLRAVLARNSDELTAR
jgi:hypothetical protein